MEKKIFTETSDTIFQNLTQIPIQEIALLDTAAMKASNHISFGYTLNYSHWIAAIENHY
jgi:hypothetical protein